MRKKISIISSCYNEAGNLWELYDRIISVMNKFPQYDFEYVLVENGSTDDTQNVLRAIAEKDKRIKVIINTRCFPSGRSAYNAWRALNGDCMVALASDLQDPPEYIEQFIKKWEEGYKVVLGIKNKSKENPLMFLVRKQYYKLMRAISEVESIDNFTGFGLYDRDAYSMMAAREWPPPYQKVYINELGFDKAIIYYTQAKRKAGKSSHNFLSLYDVAMNGITSYSKLPLRIAALAGSCLSALSLLTALIYLIIKLLNWHNMPMGTAPLIIGMFFFFAVQIFFIGIVGEYILQILKHVDKKPLVVEKERINFDVPSAPAAPAETKEHILSYISDYYKESRSGSAEYKPGDRILYAARVYDETEMINLVDSALEFWLTAGRYTAQFESGFAEYLDVKHCALVNSGSSANLLAFMTLTSPLLGKRAICRGDEVITVAAGFPTTVAPIIQYGAVPVFVDVTISQYNIDVSMLENALSRKTKVVMAAHTLGNPFDLSAVRAFCDKHSLWLVEDNCDALGSVYSLNGAEYFTGTVGDIGTSSFYPPHHMTMGEGGAVYTNDPLLSKIIFSMRDWGRDCACPSGHDNLCGRRFDNQYGELPVGYDHKYVYSHFGYNLKATDMQAAIGVAQLQKLPGFVNKRRHNFEYLYDRLKDLSDKLILPEACPNSRPSWFGFPITCREGVSRNSIVEHLEANNIQTRMLFAGNLIKHPCFDAMRVASEGYRVVGTLENTDRIMNDTFWIGVYPGMTEPMLDAMAEQIHAALKK